ncbi:RepA protein [Paraburkholderia fungorum]|jgi:Plasmid encoded RepA protein|uniref:replication protein RepA n=1 Tax=Paraburkholderia fungorum TaxID=134537 RepID=UPI000D47B780|nr:replication protein RepA [Paraburkholderia fungorum]PRZ52401.1 RepA protein [Paraburkholderia fungorum]
MADDHLFDESAYRSELVNRGIPPADAALTAANMARARATRPGLKSSPAGSIALPPEGTELFDDPAPTHEKAPVSKVRRTTSLQKSDPGALTKRQRMLIEEALMIEEEEAGVAGATGYLARTLAQATLPHSDPKLPLGHIYSRDTGKLTLTVSPTSKRYGIPYGSVPRMILAWICTEAVYTKERMLSLGHSQAEFLEKVGLHSNGRDIKRFRDQSMRLFKAVISIEYVDDHVDSSKRLMISDQSNVFWHPKSMDQKAIWESTLELSQRFFDEILSAPVPIKMEVCHALTKSPFAMDIYAWITYRMYILRVSGRSEALIPWIALKQQFGAGYPDTQRGVYDFKANFKKRLREVLTFYREADGHVTVTTDHLRLTPCPLHIAPR